MSEWRDVTLGSVLTLQRGFDLTQNEATPGDVPVISSGGRVYTTNIPKVDGPGVVTGRKGTLGRVHWSEGAYWPHDTTLWVKDFKGSEPRYVYYMLQTLLLSDLDAGAANPTLNRNHAHMLPVRVPDVRTQRIIANALRRFDDLILNNRRRVEVLEEMARTIYREWFVKFRYPGHEDVTLVDSALGLIPNGWAATTVGDVLELKYGKALKADDRRGGEIAVVSSAGIVGWHDEAIVNGPVIVIGRKGNVGSVHWVDGPSWPIDTAYYVSTGLPLRFVVEQLRRTEFTNTHAAVPGLSRDGAYSRPFLLPPGDLLTAFEAAVDPMGIEVSALSKQRNSLASLRDLLLPRLVTGEIDVSKLDLNALVEGQVS